MYARMLIESAAQRLQERNRLTNAAGAAFGMALGLLGAQPTTAEANYCCVLAYSTTCPSPQGTYVWSCCVNGGPAYRCYEDHTNRCSYAESIPFTC